MNDDRFEDGSDVAPPHPHDFAAELIRQLYADLDAVMLDDEGQVCDDAFDIAVDAATAARPRGAVLMILARAALSAHRQIVFGETTTIDDLAAGEAIASMVPQAAVQLPALRAQAERLVRCLGTADPSNESIHAPLARAIQRFYSALEVEDTVTGLQSLSELRSMLVHLDAWAMTLDRGSATAEPLRVIRPDRFHDYFMRYSELAQNPENHGREAVRATLTQDGRISAVITDDSHPLEAAALTVREMITGDNITRDHALARIHALLETLDQLRRHPQPLIGDAIGDDGIRLSLIIAAATAPLQASTRFGLIALTQITRYNQMLLNGTGNPAKRH